MFFKMYRGFVAWGFIICAAFILLPQNSKAKIKILPNDMVAKDTKVCFGPEELHSQFKRNFADYRDSGYQEKFKKFKDSVGDGRPKYNRHNKKKGGYNEQSALRDVKQDIKEVFDNVTKEIERLERNLYNSTRWEQAQIRKAIRKEKADLKFLSDMRFDDKQIWTYFGAYYEANTKLMAPSAARPTVIGHHDQDYSGTRLTTSKAVEICTDFITELLDRRYHDGYVATKTVGGSKCGRSYSLEGSSDRTRNNNDWRDVRRPTDKLHDQRYRYDDHDDREVIYLDQPLPHRGGRTSSLLPNGKSNFGFAKFSKVSIRRLPACATNPQAEARARRRVEAQCRSSIVACKENPVDVKPPRVPEGYDPF